MLGPPGSIQLHYKTSQDILVAKMTHKVLLSAADLPQVASRNNQF